MLRLVLFVTVMASVSTGADAQEIWKPDPKLPSVKEQLAKEFASDQKMSPEIMMQYATRLGSILVSSTSGEWEKLEAIQLLKELKPELGAPLLVDNITYKVTQGRSIYSPCLKALVEMGEPTVPFIVDKLKEENIPIEKFKDEAVMQRTSKYVLAILYIKRKNYDAFLKENEGKLSPNVMYALNSFAMY